MQETSESKERIVKSSLIQAYRYDAQNLKLSVTFRDGANVDYFDVPPPVMSDVFDRPGSIGARFVRHIVRGNFKHEKV
jgi:hypothetical protein